MQILEEEQENAKLVARCEEKKKDRAKHWHCDTKVQDKELKILEEGDALNIGEGVGEGSNELHDKDRSGVRWLSSQSSLWK